MNRDTQTFHSNTLLRPILSVCVLLMLIVAAAGVAAAAMPPVPYFSQCDSRWGSDRLGGDGPTIRSMGCALTSSAMVAAYYGVDTDPKRLNDAIGRGGYDAGYNIYWSAVRNACHDETNQIEYSPGTVEPFDTTVLDNHLDAGRPVIVEVYCNGHGGYWGHHFVVVTGRSDGTYYINDPGFATISTLDDYPTRYGMRIFSGNPPVERVNKPLVGDWNGNGTDTTGIYNYTTANFSLDSGLNISFGISGDIPITGDWNGNGSDTIGVFRPSTAQFFLDYDNDAVSDMNATFGVIGDSPVAGDWDGDSDDNIGVYRPGTGEFFMDATVPEVSSSKTIYVDDDFSDNPSEHKWDTIQEGVDGDGDCDVLVYREFDPEYNNNLVFYFDLDLSGDQADLTPAPFADNGDVAMIGDCDYDGYGCLFGVPPEECRENQCMRSGMADAAIRRADGKTEMGAVSRLADIITVDDSGGADYTSIQAAINASKSGDTIIVYNGTYYENVVANKQLTLTGVGMPVVDGGWNDSVIEVTADYCIIDGFRVIHSSHDWHSAGIDVASYGNDIKNNSAQDNNIGIFLDYADSNTLTNNTISDNSYGIYLWYSSSNKLMKNNASNNCLYGIWMYYSSSNTLMNVTASNNSYYGIYLSSSSSNTLTNVTASNNDDSIHLSSSSNNTLTNITASNNRYGIRLYSSSSNTLTESTMSENRYNLYVWGDSLSDYTQNIDTSNTVDGKPIYYWVDQQDKQIPCDAGFVGVVNCENITVRDLILTNNTHGVLFAYTNNSRIENVTSSNNGYGIYLYSSNSNTLTNVTTSNNDECGICLSSSSINTLTNVTSSNNYYYGIYLSSSSSSTLTNITASNNGCDGIWMYRSSSNTLTNITASNNGYGVHLYSSSSNTLTNITASNNGYGIYLSSSSSNTLTNITASNNDWYGICLSSSSSNTLTENTMSENRYNFGVWGWGDSLSCYTQNIDTSNTVDGKPIYYWVDQQDKQIPCDAGFVGVVNSKNITVRDMTLTNNTQGVLFAYTDNSRIKNVTVSNNSYGIYLYHSISNTLTNNNASNNDDDGIYLHHSSSNTLTNNNASNNDDYGICLYHRSSSNTLTNLTASNNYGGIYLSSSNSNTLTNITASNNGNYGIHLSSLVSNTLTNVTASNNDGYGIYMYSSSCSTLTNINALNNDGYGVCLYHCSSSNTLTNVTASNNGGGIYLYHHSGSNTLRNVNATNNDDYGIYLYYSGSNTLMNVTASNNDYGIYLYYSGSNTLTEGMMYENRYNFGVYGYSIFYSTQNIDTSNMVNGKPIYYWVDQQDKQIPCDAGFVGVVNSTNITVRNLTLTNNTQGVLFTYTDNSRIENVAASNNDECGICLHYSNSNTLKNNSASNDGYGIQLYHSSNNTLYHNNLINNTDHNAYDDSTNTWDSGSEGNYYSDYNGTDPDGNGIGNDPYSIPGGGGSVDNYPLMQPWTGSTPPKGDLNGDDRITPSDAAIALEIAAGGSASCDPTMLAAADVSGDGRVTSRDALMLLQAAAGAIEL